MIRKMEIVFNKNLSSLNSPPLMGGLGRVMIVTDRPLSPTLFHGGERGP
jgi:hypothetical protein